MAENNNGVQVSILCTAYNHAKYIRQCLDGFVMQKGVTFEIIIHDDASTDGTADIIREYEAKYPQLFKPIYQTENQYSQHIPFSRLYMIPKVTGKYVALCEGDDFWTDEYKLKKQYDALEANPDCYMCLHKVKIVKEDGVSWDGRYTPYCDYPSMKMTTDFYFKDKKKAGYFQTSSYFFEAKHYIDYILNPPDFRKVAPVGDEAMLLYFPFIGNVYYIDAIMSHYRFQSEGSWSSRINLGSNNNDLSSYYQKKREHHRRIGLMVDKFNEFSNNQYKEEVQYLKDAGEYVKQDEFRYYVDTKDYYHLLYCFKKKELMHYGMTYKDILKMELSIHLPSFFAHFFN